MQPLSALFVDFDAYFASVEQHLRPELRGRAVGIVPVMAESSCCIAASYQAKAQGVSTGTRVADARRMSPGIAIIQARPEVYVHYHHLLLEQIEHCIHIEQTLSIDEVWCWLPYNWREPQWVRQLASQIQQRIHSHVSEVITCSVGAAPNQWLAKMASKMNKPNGVFIIEQADLPHCLHPLELSDIHGVGRSRELHLHAHGIDSVAELCAANKQELRSAWGSVEGEYLWRQLRGEEVERPPTQRSHIGHSHVLPPDMRPPEKASAVLHKLTQKAVSRMRDEGYLASQLHLQISFVCKETWELALGFEASDDQLFFARCARKLWQQRPYPQHAIQKISISLSKLLTRDNFTPSLFQHDQRTQLNKALDTIADKFGNHALFFGSATDAMRQDIAPMRISFGHVPKID